MSVLRLSNLNVSYDQTQIIKDLDLVIESGEIVALFGPSGGGKSTVLKAIAGLLEQTSGDIFIAEEQVQGAKFHAPAEQRQAGLIFQDYALFPHLTVAENIAFGLKKKGSGQNAKRVEELLQLIQLPDLAKRYPHELSGGQQQRVAIARALARKPAILLFDEAFSNIDPQFRFELIADIRQLLKSQNIAGLFVTHNQDEAFAFCDQIAVLNQGKIEQVATAEELFTKPDSRFVAEFLGQGIWLDCKVESQQYLSSELGKLNYQGEQNMELLKDKALQVYLRPHQLSLQSADDANALTVESERFVGEFYESNLHWQEQEIKVRTSQSFLGKKVNLHVDSAVSKVFTSQ